ncbi:low density lipoprotein receptor adapter protein-like [Tropilaelaps mercedesae]|uniref:Low density lipoprotein receptor adapter protein-like n=1 Tax=Tropilaelaps mercedesae TaxID=418985 RepID=A0A1V9X3P6_9ACAR|nr:low density lipoprotein receptor adapter protein-like [Tropilaelaps mercedesae]
MEVETRASPLAGPKLTGLSGLPGTVSSVGGGVPPGIPGVPQGSSARMEGSFVCTVNEADYAPNWTVVTRHLGSRATSGLWGLRHTRSPVDELVEAARRPHCHPRLVRLSVSPRGVSLTEIGPVDSEEQFYPIECISYGVQDVSYAKIVAMIVVSDKGPLECHAFVCESKDSARRLTLTLAAAFREYGRRKADHRRDAKRRNVVDLRGEQGDSEV